MIPRQFSASACSRRCSASSPASSPLFSSHSRTAVSKIAENVFFRVRAALSTSVFRSGDKRQLYTAVLMHYIVVHGPSIRKAVDRALRCRGTPLRLTLDIDSSMKFRIILEVDPEVDSFPQCAQNSRAAPRPEIQKRKPVGISRKLSSCICHPLRSTCPGTPSWLR